MKKITIIYKRSNVQFGNKEAIGNRNLNPKTATMRQNNNC